MFARKRVQCFRVSSDLERGVPELESSKQRKKIAYAIFLCCRFSYVRPSGYYMYHQFQHSKILSAHRVFLRAVYGSHNQQLLLLHTALGDFFLQPRRSVFTALYGLKPVILESKISTVNMYIATWITS